MEEYSILSSVYQGENPEYLRQSMESMVNQTVKSNDYVIVEDGPLTDRLRAVLNEYQAKYDYIHLIRIPENRGLGNALRVGLKQCKNSLVARMDTDDVSMPDRMELQLKFFEDDNSLDICGSYMYEFHKNIWDRDRLKKMPVTHEEIYKCGKRKNPFNHSTVMFRKETVMGMGSYNPKRKRGQDFDLFTRMLIKGARGYNVPEPLVYYRVSDDQYERRVSHESTRMILGIEKRNYQAGYAGIADLVYVYAFQMAAHFMPKRVGGFLYKRMNRKGI